MSSSWEKYNKEAKKLDGNDYAKHILDSYFSDELALAESIDDLADQLAIVALYGELEIRNKGMCSVAIPGVNAANLFKWNKLKESLKAVKINIEKLAGYKVVPTSMP